MPLSDTNAFILYKDLAFVLVVSGVGLGAFVKPEGGNADRDNSDVSKGRAGSGSGATGAVDPSSPSTSDDEGGAGSKQSTEDGDEDEPDSKRRYFGLSFSNQKWNSWCLTCYTYDRQKGYTVADVIILESFYTSSPRVPNIRSLK